MTLAGDYIKNDNAFKGAAYATLVTSALNVIFSITGNFGFVNKLPLTGLGFNWVVPALIFGIIGAFIKSNSNKTKAGA